MALANSAHISAKSAAISFADNDNNNDNNFSNQNDIRRKYKFQ